MNKEVKQADNEQEEKQSSPLREVLDFLAPIIIALVLAMILKYVVFANAIIPTGSMLNTIHANDRVIAS